MISIRNPLQRLRRFIVARLDSETQLGLYLTVVLAVGAAALWAFGALADAVLDQATMVRLDISLDAMIHRRVTPGGLTFFKYVTNLGDPAVIVTVAVTGAILLWVRGHRATLVGWIAAFAGAGVLERMLKLAVHRGRPVYGAEYLSGHSFSFPSGHSMGVVVVVGMVLYVVGLYWQASRWVRKSLIALGVLIIVLVGVSRVYLGVHYPSDVLGGYAAAAGWVAACIGATTIVRERGKRVSS